MARVKNRDSNFELLRIVAIIIIILHHFAYHNGLYQLAPTNLNFYIGLFLFSLGKIGVTLFILISGYFMINRKISIKKMIMLWVEVEFYIILMAIITALFKGAYPLGFKDTVRLLMPIIFNKYWFITAYMGLYMLSPIINKVLLGITKKQFRALIAIGFVLFMILYSFIRDEQVTTTVNNISSIVLFAYIYMIGAYIKLYDISILAKRKQITLSMILLPLFILYYAVLLIVSLYFKKINVAYYIDFKFIPVFFISVLIFYIFKRIPIRNNKVINFIASSVFGVYLFQSHPLFGGQFLYKELINSENYYNSKYLILFILIVTVIVFTAGILTDKIRKIIEKLIFNAKWCNKLFERINSRINNAIGGDYFE